MPKKILKYSFITIICLIIILAIANPSPKQFKDFIGEPSFNHYSMIYKRSNNWLVFSTYKCYYASSIPDEDSNPEITNPLKQLTGTYIGFCLNFYKK